MIYYDEVQMPDCWDGTCCDRLVVVTLAKLACPETERGISCVSRGLSQRGFPGWLLWFLIRVVVHNVLFWNGKKVVDFFFCVRFAGTLYAACELMKKQQAEVLGCMVVIELKELNGRDKLKPRNVFSLVQYWGRLQPPHCSYAGDRLPWQSGALRVTAAKQEISPLAQLKHGVLTWKKSWDTTSFVVWGKF